MVFCGWCWWCGSTFRKPPPSLLLLLLPPLPPQFARQLSALGRSSDNNLGEHVSERERDRGSRARPTDRVCRCLGGDGDDDKDDGLPSIGELRDEANPASSSSAEFEGEYRMNCESDTERRWRAKLVLRLLWSIIVLYFGVSVALLFGWLVTALTLSAVDDDQG